MRKYLLLIPLLLFAGDIGGIKGRVLTYNTREPIYGADIIVEQTMFHTLADKKGDYRIRFLPVGTYSICATAEGYDTLMYKGVYVSADRITYLDFQIKPVTDSSISYVVDSTKIYEYGFLIGKVADRITGDHIPKTTITIEKIQDKRPNYRMMMFRNVDNEGIYYFRIVPVGTYKLMADMTGYKPYICEEIIIEPNDTTISNFSMSHYDTPGGDIHIVSELQCVVTTEKQTYYPGESFIIVCTIRNLTKKPIRLCKYSDHGGAILEFSKVDSLVVHNVATLRGLCSFGQIPGKDDFVVITKANSFIKEFDYTDMIHEPGQYEYSIRLVFKQSGSEYGFNAWTGSLESNTINFEVKAR